MILADTGFWLALANRRDSHHARAKAALARHRGPFVSTWPVVTETCHLLVSRLGMDAELAFVRSATLGAFDIFALDRTHLQRAESLIEKYRALPMDLADASLVILAEARHRERSARAHPQVELKHSVSSPRALRRLGFNRKA